MLQPNYFDGLLVSTQLCPQSVLNHLLPFVAGSRPIIFYGAHKEPLVDLAVHMRRSPECLNVQLTESWLREHQVLSGRTHPMMNMSSGGGFLLSTTKVIDCPALPSYHVDSLPLTATQTISSTSQEDTPMEEATPPVAVATTEPVSTLNPVQTNSTDLLNTTSADTTDNHSDDHAVAPSSSSLPSDKKRRYV
ncbi:hypothetical protein BDF19DRAFT_69616 [Syncephalis fuscata]|nr:hypothetical protein BDF19DRAFT_69616 [Syncephalis fuscata]